MLLKKTGHVFLLLLGITLLSGLFILNYIYPATLGKNGILYSDYGKFYHSQRLFIEGKNIYSPVYFIKNKLNVNSKGAKPSKKSHVKPVMQLAGNLNPPFFTLITFPLAYLSYPNALLLWSFLSLLAGALSILFIEAKLDHPAIVSLPASLFLLIAFFSYFPTFATLQFGQVTLLLLPLLVLAWRAARSQQTIKAAISLGLATSLKPFIGLFLIYFLVRKEWHALLAFTITLLICALITIMFFGINSYWFYFKALHPITWAASSWNASIYGFLLRLIGGPEGNIPIILLPKLLPTVYLLSSALMLWFIIRFLQYTPDMTPQQKTDLDFSIILPSMLLLSPLGWLYYFPFLSIPFLILWNIAKKGIYPTALPLLLATLILLSNIPTTLIASNEIKENNVLIVFLAASLYSLVLIGLIGLLFLIRYHLLSKPSLHFEKTPSTLLLLVGLVVFLPSLFGITKASYNWICHGVSYSKEYTQIF